MSGSANCSYSSLSDLDGLETLSRDDLAAWVRDCPSICSILAGDGNPDLFGIGVGRSFQYLQYL